jgi:hypothetical protein
MRGTQAALEAVAADDVALCRDQIPDGQQSGSASLGPELGNFSREFMAHDDWRPEPITGPAVPLPYMKVGAADAGVVDSDERVTGSAGRDGNFSESDSRSGGLF